MSLLPELNKQYFVNLTFIKGLEALKKTPLEAQRYSFEGLKLTATRIPCLGEDILASWNPDVHGNLAAIPFLDLGPKQITKYQDLVRMNQEIRDLAHDMFQWIKPDKIKECLQVCLDNLIKIGSFLEYIKTRLQPEMDNWVSKRASSLVSEINEFENELEKSSLAHQYHFQPALGNITGQGKVSSTRLISGDNHWISVVSKDRVPSGCTFWKIKISDLVNSLTLKVQQDSQCLTPWCNPTMGFCFFFDKNYCQVWNMGNEETRKLDRPLVQGDELVLILGARTFSVQLEASKDLIQVDLPEEPSWTPAFSLSGGSIEFL